MALIQERTVMIRLSKLVKAGDKEQDIGPDGFEASIEEVVTALVSDPTVIVEVEAIDEID